MDETHIKELQRERYWYRDEYLRSAKASNWEKYVGLYTREDNSLILQYSNGIDKLFYPYGYEWDPYTDDDSIDLDEDDLDEDDLDEDDLPEEDPHVKGRWEGITVKGTWDNWKEEYPLLRKVLKEYGMFVGYGYGINLKKELYDTKCEFKLIDPHGNWLEPVDPNHSYDEVISFPKQICSDIIYKNSIWNAIVHVKYNKG